MSRSIHSMRLTLEQARRRGMTLSEWAEYEQGLDAALEAQQVEAERVVMTLLGMIALCAVLVLCIMGVPPA